MQNMALGLIETKGFVALVVGADCAVKSADVKLLGYEIVHHGLVTVLLSGSVEAVSVAVNAGVNAAKQTGIVCNWLVIPGPYPEIVRMLQKKRIHERGSAYVQEHFREHRHVERFEQDTVVELRRKVRLIKQSELTGRQISKANRETLLRLLRTNLGREESENGERN